MISRNALVLLLMFAAAIYGGAKIYVYVAATQHIKQWVTPLAAYGEFHYSGLSASLRGPISIKDVRFVLSDGGTIGADKLTLSQDGAVDGRSLPTELLFRAEGIEFDAAILQPLRDTQMPRIVHMLGLTQLVRDMLTPAKLGYSQLRMNLELSMQPMARRDKYTVVLHKNIQNMGDLEWEVELTDVSRVPGVLPIDGYLTNALFRFQDSGFLDNLLEFYARQQHEGIDVYRADMAYRLPDWLSESDIRLGAGSVRSLQDFIRNPNVLRIQLQPDAPVQLSSLSFYKPADLPGLLKVQIRTH